MMGDHMGIPSVVGILFVFYRSSQASLAPILHFFFALPAEFAGK